MVALGLLNVVSLLLCTNSIVAYQKYSARIVTPINENFGGKPSGQNIPSNIMFPPSTSNPVNIPTTFNLPGTMPTTEAATSSVNGNGFVLPTSLPIPTLALTTDSTTVPSTTSSISPTPEQTETPSPTVQAVTDVTPDINPLAENTSVSVPDEQNDNNDITGEQSSPIIQNKMIFEEKCEEYYRLGSRQTRKTQVQVFIVGGTNSLPKEFPHMAALGYGKDTKKEWLCGGSLISENYVVTAAHCLWSKTLGDVQFIRLGTTNLQVETLESADYTVIKRIPHPDYKKDEQYNDIALLQLDQPVKFFDNIAPICLYSSKNIGNKNLVAIGWGKTESAGEVSPELQKVDLEYFPNSECQLSYAVISKQDLPRGIVDETQICAGSRREQKDTCQGDSGGPLQIQENGRMYLVGITSFGIGCGEPGSPGVYTRVSFYIPWIQKIVWGK